MLRDVNAPTETPEDRLKFLSACVWSQSGTGLLCRDVFFIYFFFLLFNSLILPLALPVLRPQESRHQLTPISVFICSHLHCAFVRVTRPLNI